MERQPRTSASLQIPRQRFSTSAYLVTSARAEAVIRSHLSRKIKRLYGRVLYQTRNIAERLFSRIKHFRRVATAMTNLQGTISPSLAGAFGPLARK